MLVKGCSSPTPLWRFIGGYGLGTTISLPHHSSDYFTHWSDTQLKLRERGRKGEVEGKQRREAKQREEEIGERGRGKDDWKKEMYLL